MNDMLVTKGKRLIDEAKTSTPERCPICEWPLADSREKGCVTGDCSFRPRDGTYDYYRIKERRAAINEATK